MSFFHAFYVMSYTATTIGFGELPHEFTEAQRLWVTISIYLSVIGWAYAIGSLLTLIQDRTFRRALALQHFTRKVKRLREPFLLLAGYGQTGRRVGRTFDSLGRRFVVVDASEENIEALDLEAYRFDVPGLAADARNPDHLGVAGLGHSLLRGRAGDDQRRRGEPRRHHGRRAAAARPAGDRPDRVAGHRAPHAGASARRPWSTRSTGSATTCGWRCARRPPTSC